MNTIDPSLLLMIEAALPFIILSIVLSLVLMSGRKKMKKAAKQLILDVKASEKKDKDAVKNFLKNNLHLEKKQVNKVSKKILNERKFLLRNILSGILDKNLDAISALNQDLNRVCKQYHQLELVDVKDEVETPIEVAAEPTNDDESIELKNEIKDLKQEVQVTLGTLNNIFKEFSSMFGEDVSGDDMSVEQIITAMESFSNKDASNESSTAEDKEVAAGNETPKESLNDTNDTNDTTDTLEIQTEETPPEEESVSEDLLEDSLDDPNISDQLDSILGDSTGDDLDFSGAEEVDDIDGALDMLELDATDDDEDEGEPDWGDAFAESGDVIDNDKTS